MVLRNKHGTFVIIIILLIYSYFTTLRVLQMSVIILKIYEIVIVGVQNNTPYNVQCEKLNISKNCLQD